MYSNPYVICPEEPLSEPSVKSDRHKDTTDKESVEVTLRLKLVFVALYLGQLNSVDIHIKGHIIHVANTSSCNIPAVPGLVGSGRVDAKSF